MKAILISTVLILLISFISAQLPSVPAVQIFAGSFQDDTLFQKFIETFIDLGDSSLIFANQGKRLLIHVNSLKVAGGDAINITWTEVDYAISS